MVHYLIVSLNFKTLNFMFPFFRKLTYLLFIFLFLFASCKTQKEAKTIKKIGTSGNFQSEDEVKFNYFYVEGAKQMMLKNLDAARAMFETCLTIKPKSAATLYHLSKVYWHKDAPEQAILLAKAAIEANTKNIWYKLYLVELYNATKKYEDASKILINLIKIYPEKENLYFELSELYLSQNQFSNAINTLQALENKFQESNEISEYKIQIYYQQQDYKSISEELTRLILRNPESVKYHGMLAEVYAKLGELKKAEEIYEKLDVLAPGEGKSQISAAFFYLTIQNYEKSMYFQKKAFANKSAGIDAKVELFLKVVELEKQVYSEQSIFDLLNVLVETHPDDLKAKILYYNYLYLKGDYSLAYEVLLEILETNKSDFELWEQLFQIEIELDKFTELKAHTDEALTYFPNQPLIYYFSGFAELQNHKYEQAVVQLENSLSVLVDNQKLEEEILVLLAQAYYKNKQVEKAFKTFDKVLVLNQSNALILNNYAYYLSLEKTQLGKALEMSKKANQLVLNNANYLDTEAWILFEQANYTESLAIMQQALEYGGRNSPTILEHYGDILWKLNDKVKALEQWKLAKKIGNTSTKLEQKIISGNYLE